MPRLALSSSDISKTLEVIGAIGFLASLIPFSPAVKQAARRRYGLAVGSAERISRRVLISSASGIRTSGERFLEAQEI